jgi:hypothetical protein
MWIVTIIADPEHDGSYPTEYVGPFDTKAKAQAWIDAQGDPEPFYQVEELSSPN